MIARESPTFAQYPFVPFMSTVTAVDPLHEISRSFLDLSELEAFSKPL